MRSFLLFHTSFIMKYSVPGSESAVRRIRTGTYLYSTHDERQMTAAHHENPSLSEDTHFVILLFSTE